MTDSHERCRLYLISPAKINIEAFARQLRSALDAGDVASFQLRLKPANDEEICKAAEALIPICEEFDVTFLLNDRADLARDTGADGVHLGQNDGTIKEAREMLGVDSVIGVTCHDSKHLAFVAGEAGADYIAFGAFFETHTKKTEFHARPHLLTWWNSLAEIPCVAIGGITVGNCKPLIESGANFLAVSSGVWDYDKGPAQAVKDFNAAMEKYSP